jgi:hypothetical protein
MDERQLRRRDQQLHLRRPQRADQDVLAGGTNPRTYTFSFDAAGNRLTEVVTGTSPSSQSLTYNSGNQISSGGYKRRQAAAPPRRRARRPAKSGSHSREAA